MSHFLDTPTLQGIIGDLERRVAALERTRTIPVTAGAPSAEPAEGAMQGDRSGPYLWLYVDGDWRRTSALTT